MYYYQQLNRKGDKAVFHIDMQTLVFLHGLLKAHYGLDEDMAEIRDGMADLIGRKAIVPTGFRIKIEVV